MHRRSKGFSLGEFLLIVGILAVLVWIFMPLFKDSIIHTRAIVDSSNIRNAYSELVRDVQVSGGSKSEWVELKSIPMEEKHITIKIFGTLKDPDSEFYWKDSDGATVLNPFAKSDNARYVKITVYCDDAENDEENKDFIVTVSYESFEKIEH